MKLKQVLEIQQVLGKTIPSTCCISNTCLSFIISPYIKLICLKGQVAT